VKTKLQGRVRNGFFIEAGAWDFEFGSNTLYFEVKSAQFIFIYIYK
jgi:hypothetical protein